MVCLIMDLSFSSSNDANRSRRCAKRFSSKNLPIAISQPPARNDGINNFRNIHVVLVEKVWQQNHCSFDHLAYHM